MSAAIIRASIRNPASNCRCASGVQPSEAGYSSFGDCEEFIEVFDLQNAHHPLPQFGGGIALSAHEMRHVPAGDVQLVCQPFERRVALRQPPAYLVGLYPDFATHFQASFVG